MPFLPHIAHWIRVHTSSYLPHSCIRITHPCCVASDLTLSPVRVNTVYFPIHWGWAWPCDILWPMESGLKWGCTCSELNSQQVNFHFLLPSSNFAIRTTWPKVAFASRMRLTGAKPSWPAAWHRAAQAYHRPIKQKLNAYCFKLPSFGVTQQCCNDSWAIY